MENFGNFKVYAIATGSPSLTLTKNGVGLSKATVLRLDKAPFIQILFDTEARLMAIRKCDETDEGALQFYDEKKRTNIRWNNKELCNRVERLAQLPSEPGFKAEGMVDEDEGFVIFDLKKAKSLA